jgi:hypothetical protein
VVVLEIFNMVARMPIKVSILNDEHVKDEKNNNTMGKENSERDMLPVLFMVSKPRVAIPVIIVLMSGERAMVEAVLALESIPLSLSSLEMRLEVSSVEMVMVVAMVVVVLAVKARSKSRFPSRLSYAAKGLTFSDAANKPPICFVAMSYTIEKVSNTLAVLMVSVVSAAMMLSVLLDLDW